MAKDLRSITVWWQYDPINRTSLDDEQEPTDGVIGGRGACDIHPHDWRTIYLSACLVPLPPSPVPCLCLVPRAERRRRT